MVLASPSMDIPRATLVQPPGGQVATSWLLPPGANYPSATATIVAGQMTPGLTPRPVGGPVFPAGVTTGQSGDSTPQPSFATAVLRQSSVPTMLSIGSPPFGSPAAPSVQRMVSGSGSPAAPSVQRMVSGAGSSAAPSVQRMVSGAPSVQRMVSGTPGFPAPYQSYQMAQPAAVVVVEAPVAVPTPTVPLRPPKLTDSLPDPSSVDRQKLQHAKGLLERLQADTAVLTQQNQVRKAMLAQYGAQQKAQHATQVDADLQREAMAVEQRGNAQLLQLQQAVMAQTMALEQQAAGLTLRYQCQVVEEDRQQKDYDIQRQFYESEMKILGQMQKLVRDTASNQVVGESSSLLSSQRNTFRDTNSFDAYLGNPGGRPVPVPRQRGGLYDQ